MKYEDFQKVMSVPRMSRYVSACGRDTRKVMTLYRLNLKISQELFTVISCFEIALRNKIDQHYTSRFGNDWLRDSALPGGMYNNRHCGKTPYIISEAMRKLNVYSHSKLVAEMDFGFWRYNFARQHYVLIQQFFQWMQIDEAALLYRIDHIATVLNKIDAL